MWHSIVVNVVELSHFRSRCADWLDSILFLWDFNISRVEHGFDNLVWLKRSRFLSDRSELFKVLFIVNTQTLLRRSCHPWKRPFLHLNVMDRKSRVFSTTRWSLRFSIWHSLLHLINIFIYTASCVYHITYIHQFFLVCLSFEDVIDLGESVLQFFIHLIL